MRRATEALSAAWPTGIPARGVWRLVLGVGLLAVAATGIGCEAASRKDGASLTTLPGPVKDALDRAAGTYQQPLSGATWSKVARLGRTDHPLYQLQGTNERGNRVEIEVTGAGRVIEVEEHGIPLSEVPSAVTDALKARMPEFTPAKVEAIYQADLARPACYGFEGKDAAGKSIEVYLSADGKTWLN